MTQDLTSIIILNHNTWDECTCECLLRVQRHTQPPYEVILVDNGSTTGEKTQLEEHVRDIASITMVSLPENLGFAAGNNGGLDAVSPHAHQVCLLNSDCYINEARWNQKARQLFEDDPQLGAVSLTSGEKCHFIDGEFGDAYWFEPGEPPYDCEWINGACLVMDCSRVGAIRFDKYYSPAYWEDTDLSFQIRSQGWSLVQRPDFDIRHLGSRTVAKMRNCIPYQGQLLMVQYLYERNRAYLLRKWKAMLHPRLDERESLTFIRQFYSSATRSP